MLCSPAFRISLPSRPMKDKLSEKRKGAAHWTMRRRSPNWSFAKIRRLVSIISGLIWDFWWNRKGPGERSSLAIPNLACASGNYGWSKKWGKKRRQVWPPKTDSLAFALGNAPRVIAPIPPFALDGFFGKREWNCCSPRKRSRFRNASHDAPPDLSLDHRIANSQWKGVEVAEH